MGRTRRSTGHVTISDIARRANVSTSAVSYALNGKPGVAEPTRMRIVALANEMGWSPNSSARALQAARTNAVGLVLTGDEEGLVSDESSYLFRLLPGIESALSTQDMMLVLRTVRDLSAEMTIYRKWRSERRVDGVIVLNLRVRDPRPRLLTKLGLPAVVAGDRRTAGSGPPSVWTDDERSMAMAVNHLASLGHRRIARIGGRPEFAHSTIRKRSFVAAMAKAGLPADLSRDAVTETAAETATRELLTGSKPPTAIIYEGDSVAMRCMLALREIGVRVPEDVSIMAWDDSLLCRTMVPPLTVAHRDIVEYGRRVSGHLAAVLAGESVGHIRGTHTTLMVRGSTAAPTR